MKNNNKIYTISLFFAIVSLVLVIFGVWPLFNEIEKNSKELILLKNNGATLKAQTVEMGIFKGNYDNYRQNFELIDQMFVDPANPVNFIKFLEETALNCQIDSKISLPTFLKNSQQISQDFIVFQFISKGNFSDVLNFLKKIELGPYLIEIENLTIQNLKTDEGKVEATFSMKVFIKK